MTIDYTGWNCEVPDSIVVALYEGWDREWMKKNCPACTMIQKYWKTLLELKKPG